MTTQEADRVFRQELRKAIANARSNGLADDTIASDLRSIAYDVSWQWKLEQDRRNAERIAQMTARAGRARGTA